MGEPEGRWFSPAVGPLSGPGSPPTAPGETPHRSVGGWRALLPLCSPRCPLDLQPLMSSSTNVFLSMSSCLYVCLQRSRGFHWHKMGVWWPRMVLGNATFGHKGRSTCPHTGPWAHRSGMELSPVTTPFPSQHFPSIWIILSILSHCWIRKNGENNQLLAKFPNNHISRTPCMEEENCFATVEQCHLEGRS